MPADAATLVVLPAVGHIDCQVDALLLDLYFWVDLVVKWANSTATLQGKSINTFNDLDSSKVHYSFVT